MLGLRDSNDLGKLVNGSKKIDTKLEVRSDASILSDLHCCSLRHENLKL